MGSTQAEQALDRVKSGPAEDPVALANWMIELGGVSALYTAGASIRFPDCSVLAIGLNGIVMVWVGVPCFLHDFTVRGDQGRVGPISPGSRFLTIEPGSLGIPSGLRTHEEVQSGDGAEEYMATTVGYKLMHMDAEDIADGTYGSPSVEESVGPDGSGEGIYPRTITLIKSMGGRFGPFGLIGFPDGSVLRVAGMIYEVYDSPGMRLMVATVFMLGGR